MARNFGIARRAVDRFWNEAGEQDRPDQVWPVAMIVAGVILTVAISIIVR